jgi:mannosyl-oligosaccharide alpha-1,2-mannosidase
VVLAELGSLSLEFTRLAQLTREPKYYDAIARITTELAAWQNNTKLPGLWPMKVDASGCKKPQATSTLKLPTNTRAETGDADFGNEQAAKVAGLENPSLEENATVVSAVASPSADDLLHSNVGNVKRQLAQDDLIKSTASAKADVNDTPACEPQGLASPPDSTIEEFLIGGQADSVYEYLPKEYMLLGGLEDVYRSMYEMAVEVTKKYLLFRPMVPEGRNVLLSGSLRTSGHLDDPADLSLNPEGTHLTCFAGGMFAIGAKLFNREGDMDIARKLTDGCVWAYEATTTGIMPERYLAVPCQNQERCDWNETLYHEMARAFPGSGQGQMKKSQQTVLDSKNLETNPKFVKESDQVPAEETKQSTIGPDAEAIPKVTGESGAHEARIGKRQLVDVEKEKPLKQDSKPVGAQIQDIPLGITIDGGKSEIKGIPEGSVSDVEQSLKENETSADRASKVNPLPPNPTLQGSSEARTREGRLPAGMTKVTSSAYILRYVVPNNDDTRVSNIKKPRGH